MSIMLPPPVEGIVAEVMGAIFIIAVGIVLEYKKQDRLSVLFNILGFGVILFTVQLDFLIIPILFGYLLIGLFIMLANVKILFGFFGSKAYGSLLFAIAIIHTSAYQEQITNLIQANTPPKTIIGFYLGLLSAVWIGTFIVAVFLGRKIKKRLH